LPPLATISVIYVAVHNISRRKTKELRRDSRDTLCMR
jgi:hypothetical protein